MPVEIIEYINLVFKVLRWLLVSLNSLVIVFALYFMISGNDLGGNKLKISTGVLVVLALITILVAILGIVAALWWGNKTKIHLSLIIAYAIASLVVMVIGIILAAVYVEEMDSANVAFTVLTVILSILLIKSSLGFAYAVKKTKMLRRLNVVTA